MLPVKSAGSGLIGHEPTTLTQLPELESEPLMSRWIVVIEPLLITRYCENVLSVLVPPGPVMVTMKS